MGPELIPRKHEIVSRPAPVGGVNARDAIAAMPEGDAIVLINWLADAFGLRTRKGYQEWATNLGGEVKSVLHWMGAASSFPSGTYLTAPTELAGKVFACTDDAIYDVTTTTDSPASSKVLSSGLDAGVIHSARINNIAGSFLACISELDGYFYYDGSTWTDVSFGPGAGQLDGVDPADLVFVTQWKRRLWFVERDSTSGWYLPVDSLTGTAEEFDFGAIFKNGGKLEYLATWTLDAGEGIDDFLVVVSSNGDVAIYKGTDPATAETFQLVGVFYVGPVPAGRRGFCQYGGDLVLLTANGVFPISMVTRGGSGLLLATGQEYSSKIRVPLSNDLSRSFTSLGWQMLFHPSERVLMVNIPNIASYQDRQYVMSTTGNTWSEFNGIPVRCLAQIANYVVSGTSDGRVMLLFQGYQDNVPYGGGEGSSISGMIVPSFSYFGAPAAEKHFVMARANFLATEAPSALITMSVNFSVKQPSSTPTPPTYYAPALWDVAVWDTSLWGGDLRAFNDWKSVGGIGQSGSAGIITEVSAETVLVSVDYMYFVGGAL